MTSAVVASSRTRIRRAGMVALVVGMAVLAAAGTSVGAQVLQRVVVAEPGAGATVTGTGVLVDVQGLGDVNAVHARVVSGSGKAGGVATLGNPEQRATGTRWRGNLNVAGLPNGAARVEARAQQPSGTTEWSGHDVRLSFPAPAVNLQAAPVAGRSDAVALTWPAASAPDVNRYELQRALAGGGWKSLVSVPGAQHAHTDVGVPGGTHRYRLRASRPGADGKARPGPWVERAVAVAGAGAEAASGNNAPREPSAGVAPAPPTGSNPAQMRGGTENVGGAHEGSAAAPRVAPREEFLPLDGLPADGLPVAAGPEGDVARGGDLQLLRDGDPLGSDAVRLVGLFLAGVLAWRGQQIAAGGGGRGRIARLRGAPLLSGVSASSSSTEAEPLWSRPASSWEPATRE